MSSTCSLDRKSTRLNSRHANISYAVFCLKKKTHHCGPPMRAKSPASWEPASASRFAHSFQFTQTDTVGHSRGHLQPRDRFHYFFFNDTATTEIYTLSLHDALPI